MLVIKKGEKACIMQKEQIKSAVGEINKRKPERLKPSSIWPETTEATITKHFHLLLTLTEAHPGLLYKNLGPLSSFIGCLFFRVFLHASL